MTVFWALFKVFLCMLMHTVLGSINWGDFYSYTHVETVLEKFNNFPKNSQQGGGYAGNQNQRAQFEAAC